MGKDQRTPSEIAQEKWGVENLDDDRAVLGKIVELNNSGGSRDAQELSNLWRDNKDSKEAA